MAQSVERVHPRGVNGEIYADRTRMILWGRIALQPFR
jgi:hypothetical protein